MGRVCRQSATDFLVKPLREDGSISTFVIIRAFLVLHAVTGTTWMTGTRALYVLFVTMIHGRIFPVSDPRVGSRLTSMTIPRLNSFMSATPTTPHLSTPAFHHPLRRLRHTAQPIHANAVEPILCKSDRGQYAPLRFCP